VALLASAAAVLAGLASRDPDTRLFLIVYVAPLFFAGPAWLVVRLSTLEARRSGVHLLDAAVLGLSVLRFLTGTMLPFSGHMLFLTYSGLVTSRAWYRLLAVALLVKAAVFKLWIWDDPASFVWGLSLGAVAVVLHGALRRP
jgi:hypothetical protein